METRNRLDRRGRSTPATRTPAPQRPNWVTRGFALAALAGALVALALVLRGDVIVAAIAVGGFVAGLMALAKAIIDLQTSRNTRAKSEVDLRTAQINERNAVSGERRAAHDERTAALNHERAAMELEKARPWPRDLQSTSDVD